MAFVGTILQELMKIRRRIKKRYVVYDERLQEKTLRKLVSKGRFTAFGVAYDFKGILKSGDIRSQFQRNVPIYDYDKLYDQWWHRTIQGEADVTWPGRIKYFALTSGTSGSASKRVPVSSRMMKAIRKGSLRQMLSIPDFNLSPDFYQKSVLMFGGSTQLKELPHGYEGDLSGILTSKIPKWFERFYKPGRELAKIRDWNEKLDKIAEEAPSWDIGIVCGVPAWIQLLFERILEKHNAKNIHEIWPNFSIYVHGGVAFSPYKESFKKYLGKEINYLDTYLASEGFIALQSADNHQGMQLLLDNWIFFEFIPFNEENFTAEGNLRQNPQVFLLDEVKEGVDYAILITTCSGAWRYLIGDTIRFKSLKDFEIIISGRTKHFLSLCGEHLSVDNMNSGIRQVCDELKVNVNEYTVAGYSNGEHFTHHWYIGADQTVDENLFRKKLDAVLCELNDDYSVERKHALKEMKIEVVPIERFYEFMESRGKLGGQNKFPRVMRNGMYEEWKEFLLKEKVEG
jgi:hypothetical protein